MARIGDILTRYKSPVVVQDDVTYKQVTIRTNYKGVNLRGHKDGIEIGTKNQWAVKPGQFILSRIDARQGAFGIVPEELDGAIVTNDFMAYDLNEKAVHRDFFNVFLQSPVFLNACVKASRGNTNRKRVQEDFFLDYEVNLPPLTEQKRLIRKIDKAKAKLDIADAELARQQALSGQLKQAILQAAIRGELTADWRKNQGKAGDASGGGGQETADQMLQRIATEKARLVKAKKIRKQKPLPPLTEEETTFDLPEGWAWCRLQSIANQIHYGFTASANPSVGDPKLLRITDIQDDDVDWMSVPGCVCTDEEAEKYLLSEGDILIARTGGTVGKSYLVDALLVRSIFASYLLRMIPADLKLAPYIKLYLGSKCYWSQLVDAARGAQPNVSGTKLKHLSFPLPPLAEQSAIVARVEALMTICRSLESEVAAAADHASALRRAVLQQAFAPPPEQRVGWIDTELQADPSEDEDDLLVIPGRFTGLFGQDESPPPTESERVARAGRFACMVVRNAARGQADRHFARTKLEKTNHLCEYAAGAPLNRRPVRDQFGPVDFDLLTRAEAWAAEAGGFVTTKSADGKRVVYRPGSRLDELADAEEQALGDRLPAVQRLLKLLRTQTTRGCEVLATAYAAWNDLLIDGQAVSDTRIVAECRQHWHPSKAKIKEEKWRWALQWLRDHAVIPQGEGRRVLSSTG